MKGCVFLSRNVMVIPQDLLSYYFFLEENELINHDQRSKHYNYGGITKRLLGLVTKKQLILNLNTFHGQHSSIFHIPLGYKSAR